MTIETLEIRSRIQGRIRRTLEGLDGHGVRLHAVELARYAEDIPPGTRPSPSAIRIAHETLLMVRDRPGPGLAAREHTFSRDFAVEVWKE